MNNELELQNIPDNLTEKLIDEYAALKREYATGGWTHGQLNGGRFAEVVLRIFQNLLGNPVTSFDDKIKNWDTLLSKVENDPNLDCHLRQKATSLVELLLRFRNNRDSAHINGFDANRMDTHFVMSAATWVLCEFIRLYGDCEMEEAQEIVDSLSVKNYPALISVEGETYITRHDLTAKEEILVLLYEDNRTRDMLFTKTKDNNSSRFDKKLSELKSGKFIEEKNGGYFILPRGIDRVEDKKLLDYQF